MGSRAQNPTPGRQGLGLYVGRSVACITARGGHVWRPRPARYRRSGPRVVQPERGDIVAQQIPEPGPRDPGIEEQDFSSDNQSLNSLEAGLLYPMSASWVLRFPYQPRGFSASRILSRGSFRDSSGDRNSGGKGWSQQRLKGKAGHPGRTCKWDLRLARSCPAETKGSYFCL